MEFWGVEVKAGEPMKVSPGEGYLIHLSQASIGVSKKGNNESVPIYVKVDGQKLVLGTLSGDKFPQIQYDVVFEKDFELSHNWKNGSIFFCGYKTENPFSPEDRPRPGYDAFESDSEDELTLEEGNPKPADTVAPKHVSAAETKVKTGEPVKDVNASSDDDSSDEFDSSDDDDDMMVAKDDESSDDSSDEDSDEREEVPALKKVSPSSTDEEDSSDDGSSEDDGPTVPQKENKKRPVEPVSKTPVPSKKAKFATPQKTEGKKVAAAVHVATPHPAKQVAKTAKSDAKTPASAGKVSCGTCSKTFNSDKALDSHSKAKHAVK